MSWEANQPRAVMHRASEARRRARDAAMDPNGGELKPRLATDESWKRPEVSVIAEPPPEALMNRQERLLLEIRDAIRELTIVLTKRGKR